MCLIETRSTKCIVLIVSLRLSKVISTEVHWRTYVCQCARYRACSHGIPVFTLLLLLTLQLFKSFSDDVAGRASTRLHQTQKEYYHMAQATSTLFFYEFAEISCYGEFLLPIP